MFLKRKQEVALGLKMATLMRERERSGRNFVRNTFI
jgi:hypothetical protein